MHYSILIKLRADSPEEAKDMAESFLQSSCEDGNRCGWDYVDTMFTIYTERGDVYEVTEEGVKKTILREHLKAIIKETAPTMADVESLIQHAMDQVPGSLAKNAPASDVPLMLNMKDGYGNINDKLSAAIEARCKNMDAEAPDFYSAVRNILNELVKSHMGIFYLRKASELFDCIKGKFKDQYETFQCTECHYADMTDETEGDHIYGVLGSRHL